MSPPEAHGVMGHDALMTQGLGNACRVDHMTTPVATTRTPQARRQSPKTGESTTPSGVSSSSSLMNSPPLSVSIPRWAKRTMPRARCSACTTPCWVRCRSGKHSVRRGDIRQRTRVQQRGLPNCHRSPRQVGLQKAWFDVVPLCEGAHRDLVLQQPKRPGFREPMQMTHGPQQAVDRGWTERQQPGLDLVGERHMAMPLER